MGCDRVLSVAEIPYIFMGTHTVLLVPEPVEPDRDYGYIQFSVLEKVCGLLARLEQGL